MIDTYLVQRLGPRPPNEMAAKAEQVFGGAMLGLSQDAWKLLQGVFSIDYMGAAEYEFGTIPSVLKAMAADREQLRAVEMVVAPKDIEPNFARGRTARTKKGTPRKKQPVHPPVSAKTVYVLAREAHVEEAKERIRKLAGGKMRTKMGTNFPTSLDPITEYDGRTTGWLELDNGFFFFLDKAQWRKTALLLTGKDPAPEL